MKGPHSASPGGPLKPVSKSHKRYSMVSWVKFVNKNINKKVGKCTPSAHHSMGSDFFFSPLDALYV